MSVASDEGCYFAGGFNGPAKLVQLSFISFPPLANAQEQWRVSLAAQIRFLSFTDDHFLYEN
jgi:hypothetical protein